MVATGPLDKMKAKTNGLKAYDRNKDVMKRGLQKAWEEGRLKWSDERKSMEGFRPDESHIRARVWRLRSPQNVTIGPFKNLAFFILEMQSKSCVCIRFLMCLNAVTILMLNELGYFFVHLDVALSTTNLFL